MHATIILLLVCLAASPLLAQPQPVIALPAGDAITIDGKLDDAAWQSGEWSSGFTMLDNPAQLAPVQTRFKVRHDASDVFVGAELDEPQIADLKAAETRRDGKVWSDDCLEVMLDPTGERVEYYHFMVNSLGTIYDAQMRQGGHVRSQEWDCGIQAAATLGDGKWFVEMQIPVVELGLTAASRGDWAINVTRARRGPGEELSTYSPLTGGFHQPSLYAALKMQDADFGAFLWEIKSPYEVSIQPDADGNLMYRAKTHVKNAGSRFQFIVFRGVLGASAGEWVKDGLDAGQDREYEFSVPVAAQGEQTLRLELADREQPDRLLAVRALQVEVKYSPITLDILRPWYRDCIFATEELKQIVFDVTLAMPEEQLQGLFVIADLDLADGSDAPAGMSAPRIVRKAEPKLRVEMPVEGLPVADFDLTVRLVDTQARKDLHRATRRIRKLPQVEHEWRIDEHNVLLHNGEPVLPFGWFSIPPEAMADEGHAYQLMQSYNSQYLSNDALREFLDRVVAAGTHALIYPYPRSGMISPSSVWGEPLNDADAAALAARVSDIGTHPGVFAWYMADEPELRPALPERCRRIWQVCREADPFHPCVMLNDTIAGIFKYVDGGDVLMPDPYPCFIKGGLAAQPIEKTSEFTKACREASKGRRAIWLTPQAFNYGDYDKKNQRGPNLTELRNQLYQGVVYGAKGFLWYTYSHTANYPYLDIGMRWLSFEVADLKDAILADPADNITVKVDAARPEHIHVSARRVGDDLFVFAVNTATETQDAKITLTPAPAAGSLHVVSEGRTVELRGGEIVDSFGIYETHIYTTNAEIGGRESIAVPRAAIAEADAARRKPGNLAFEDNGTTVEVSSRSTYGSTPDRVVDGVIGGMQWRDGTSRKLPDWLVIRWPEAQTIGRVVVHGAEITALEVQVPAGDDWKTVAQFTGDALDTLEISLPEPQTAAALRVLVTGLAEGHEYTQISEVEAYAK
ncbi:MAG: hypothetical protein HPY44_02810 [Armatimonadetes bacterium]|nr:hypothetical protein [Armatimonadota bacterium]